MSLPLHDEKNPGLFQAFFFGVKITGKKQTKLDPMKNACKLQFNNAK